MKIKYSKNGEGYSTLLDEKGNPIAEIFTDKDCGWDAEDICRAFVKTHPTLEALQQNLVEVH